MIRTPRSPILIAISLLVLSALACQTIVKAISPDQPTLTPVPNNSELNLSLNWLVTADELNSFSTDIGIVEWQQTQETPGENRICRTFQGASWSASPNEGLNCIYKITPGSSFTDIIDSMFSDGNLLAGAQPVNATLNFDGEYAVYAGDYTNGHGVYDLIVVKNNLFYWSSVTLGIPVGSSSAATYASSAAVIDAFLSNIINLNLQKTK